MMPTADTYTTTWSLLGWSVVARWVGRKNIWASVHSSIHGYLFERLCAFIGRRPSRFVKMFEDVRALALVYEARVEEIVREADDPEVARAYVEQHFGEELAAALAEREDE